MGKMPTKKAFESSKFDKDPKGSKEGSPKDMKRDKSEMKTMAKAPAFTKKGK